MSGEEANSMLQSVMKHHHMQMPWHNFTPDNSNTPAKRATLKEKARSEEHTSELQSRE